MLEMAPGFQIPEGTPIEDLLALSTAAVQGLQSGFVPTAETVSRHPSFHKTDSLDYLVVSR